MPKLAARFEVEAKMEGFDENAFTRRLATLVGVESIDPKAVSLNKYTANPDTFAIDVEIACPDATTLVMAAKTLKKAAGPLGLALGVKIVDSPNVTVPEPEAPSRGAPPESRGDSPPAQRSAATIQERIVMAPPGGKPAAQRRITLEKGPAAGGPLALMAPGAPASSLGALDWQFGGIGGKVAAGVGQMAGAMNPAGFMTGPPPPARPDGGIQERISLGGMARPSRGTASLRQRALAGAARIDPMAPAAGVLGGAGAVLNQAFKDERAASRARSAQMSASQRARFEERGLLGQIGIGGSAEPRDQIIGRPGATDGIQERLPAMPGMRNRQNRRAAGEPRLKAAGAVAEALQVDAARSLTGEWRRGGCWRRHFRCSGRRAHSGACTADFAWRLLHPDAATLAARLGHAKPVEGFGRQLAQAGRRRYRTAYAGGRADHTEEWC